MGEVVNLRKIRKGALRRQAAEHAAENRVLHGMSKAVRTLLKAKRDKARRELDQQRIETGDGR